MKKSIDRPSLWVALISLFTGIVLLGFSASSLAAEGPDAGLPYDPSPPAKPVKLIFIHHSTGENWLADDNGGLGIALRNNNYFVSDTNYEWGAVDPDLGGPIGSFTDIGHWWTWFRGSHSGTHTSSVLTEYGQHAAYSRLTQDPGGENEIVMFKSCFPNSALRGNPTDPPTTGENLLRGRDSGSEYHTVGNAKGIYNDLLAYFATRQDKLFVVIAAPPLRSATYAKNARAFNEWLFYDWLKDYPHRNVAVFNFYNVLTTNGGSANRNDLNQEKGNHHRWWKGAVQHKSDTLSDVEKYPSADDHPSRAGNLKATGEYPPILNIAYHCFKGTGGCPRLGDCVYTAAPAQKTLSYLGAKFPVKVTATGRAQCPTPAVVSDRVWLGANLTGFSRNAGIIRASIPVNDNSTDRSGTVSIDGNTAALKVTEKGAPCTIKPLTPSGKVFNKGGGSDSFTVTAIGGCGWKVSQDAASLQWLTVTSDGTGTGPGKVSYTVKDIGTAKPRVGKVTVKLDRNNQKQVFTVWQTRK